VLYSRKIMVHHLAIHSQRHLYTSTKCPISHQPQHPCIKPLPNTTNSLPTNPKHLKDTSSKVTKDAAEAGGEEEDAAEEGAVVIIKVDSKVSKDKEVSKAIQEDKDKDINSRTHKAFMGTKKLTLLIPIQPNSSITGITAGPMDMMCPMDTPAQPAPIQHLDTCGMPLVRIHAMAAGRGSTKQPGLDGEGRKRFH
jgi:hypothetical protein